jgi:hypothetical protein
MIDTAVRSDGLAISAFWMVTVVADTVKTASDNDNRPTIKIDAMGILHLPVITTQFISSFINKK